MNTAVQLRSIGALDRPRCALVHGQPHELLDGGLGRIALFGPGELVAYRLRSRRNTRLYVFRTLEVVDRLAASVPGVRPRVRLLVHLRTAGRARLAERLLVYLLRTGRDPSLLSDSFYLRVGAALGGRLPAHKLLLSLLSTHDAAEAQRSLRHNETSARGGGDPMRAFAFRVSVAVSSPSTVERQAPVEGEGVQ
jgi:hypothetical protein